MLKSRRRDTCRHCKNGPLIGWEVKAGIHRKCLRERRRLKQERRRERNARPGEYGRIERWNAKRAECPEPIGTKCAVAECGGVVVATDHIVPRRLAMAHGDPEHGSNQMGLCARHHAFKTSVVEPLIFRARWVEAFRKFSAFGWPMERVREAFKLFGFNFHE